MPPLRSDRTIIHLYYTRNTVHQIATTALNTIKIEISIDYDPFRPHPPQRVEYHNDLYDHYDMPHNTSDEFAAARKQNGIKGTKKSSSIANSSKTLKKTQKGKLIAEEFESVKKSSQLNEAGKTDGNDANNAVEGETAQPLEDNEKVDEEDEEQRGSHDEEEEDHEEV